MRKLLFSTVFLCLAVSMAAQPERCIYLWDVTLSMKGYQGRYPDIYDDVVKFLEQDINNKNEDTEIYVLPFQEEILERWHEEKADEAGKAKIIKKIKNFDKEYFDKYFKKPTNTNIVKPVKDVQTDIISPDKENKLILLTDGMNSKNFGGEDTLLKLIRDWKPYAEKNFARCLYVMLTEDGETPRVKDAILEQPQTMELLTGGIVLRPQSPVSFHIIEDNGKPVEIAFKAEDLQNRPDEIPDNKIKISVIAENNDYIDINQECTIQNNRISFMLNYREDILRETLSTKTPIALRLAVTNQENFQKSEKKILSIMPDNIKLELISKPEKKLIIHYE